MDCGQKKLFLNRLLWVAPPPGTAPKPASPSRGPPRQSISNSARLSTDLSESIFTTTPIFPNDWDWFCLPASTSDFGAAPHDQPRRYRRAISRFRAASLAVVAPCPPRSARDRRHLFRPRRAGYPAPRAADHDMSARACRSSFCCSNPPAGCPCCSECCGWRPSVSWRRDESIARRRKRLAPPPAPVTARSPLTPLVGGCG